MVIFGAHAAWKSRYEARELRRNSVAAVQRTNNAVGELRMPAGARIKVSRERALSAPWARRTSQPPEWPASSDAAATGYQEPTHPETPDSSNREAPRPFVLRSTPSPRVQPAVASPPPERVALPAPPQPTGPTNGADRAPSITLARHARPRPPATAEAGPVTRVLATATYVTGTARLEPGRRYAIAIQEQRLQILGPIDVDDKKVALERPVAAIKVSAVEGRLVINEETRSGVVLAFMSAAGAGLDDLAETIRASAQDAAS